MGRLLPVGTAAGLAAAAAWFEAGSIAARDWLVPYALVAAFAAATVFFSTAARRPARPAVFGLVALLLLAVWTAASITWSPTPSLARDEALLVTLYALSLATPLFLLRGARERMFALGIVVLALTIVAIATAAALRLEPEAADFAYGRLYAPIAYANAIAAFFLVGFWPAIAIAARRASPVLVRAGALGAAVALLAGWAMSQSKGGAVALVVSACVFFAVSRDRLRALVPIGIAAAFTAASFGALTEPFRVEDEAAFLEQISATGTVALAITAGAVLAGLLYALADRRLRISPRARALASTLIGALLVAGLAGGAVSAYVAVDDPGQFVDEKWEEFKVLPPPKAERTSSTHLVSLGSNRHDFWRVALNEFADHPVAGIGARGFQAVYLYERKSDETPARAHSLPLDMLSELGIVGLVLLAGAVLLPLGVILRRARGDLAAAGVLAAAVYWLAHSSVDWIWTFPAVGIPFFLLLGIGAAGDEEARPLRARAAVPAGAVCVLVAVAGFVPPWLSYRLIEQGFQGERDTASALELAARLDPLAIEPLLAQATAATTAAEALAPLEEAVERQPRSAAAQFYLGVGYLNADRPEDAVRSLEVAQRLAPEDAGIALALERARAGAGAGA